MELGIQLYGLLENPSNDRQTLLNLIVKTGYTIAEPCVALDPIPGYEHRIWPISCCSEYAEQFKKSGLKAISCHVFSNNLTEHTADMQRLTEEYGYRYFVVKSPMDPSEENLRIYAETYITVSKQIAPSGAELLLHNEYADTHTSIHGMPAYEYLLRLCDGYLFAEPDVGWLYAAGVNPVPFLERNQERIRMIHYKDFCKNLTKYQEMNIGAGETDLISCDAFAKRYGLYRIIDQDSYPVNAEHALQNAFKHFQNK